MDIRRKRGFTFVEVLFVIVIIGILAAILIPKITTESDRAREAGVDVDFRSFYLSSKTVFTLHDSDEYDTIAKFEELFNKNSSAQIQFSNGEGNLKDPWNNYYQLHASKLEDNNTYVVFTSKGTEAREGWIFEPETLTNKVRWTPETPICDCHKYFLVLGRTPTGQVITDIEPDTVYKVVHEGDTGNSEEQDQWAMLGFEVETDGIKIEHDEEENGDLYYMAYDIGGGAGGYPPSGGGAGGYLPNGGGAGGYSPNEPGFLDPMDFNRTTGGMLYISDTPLLPAYYLMAWNRTIGGNNGGYQVYTEVPTTFTTTYDGDGYASNINKDTNISEDDNKIEMEVSVGNGNKIVLTYNRADAHPETKMFKVGSSVTMKAVPDSPDYIFNYWKVDGVKDETNDIKTITVQADTKFTAVFRMNLDISGGKLYTKSGENFTEYYENNIVVLDEITDTWQVGDNVTATLSESGVLSLTGSGDITGYSSVSNYSWYSKKDLINEIIIDNGINISRYAFSNYNVDSVVLKGNNRVNYYYTFNDLTATNVIIGDGSYLESGSSVGSFHNSNITNLTIGKNVILESYESSNSAFGSSSLSAAKIENLTIDSNIPHSGFQNSGIKTLNIGSNATSIGYRAFYDCQIANTPNLSSIDLIGSDAFRMALTNADKIIIKQGTTIGSDAFYRCNINNLILQGENDVGLKAFVELKANSVTIGDGSNLRRGSFNESIITNLDIGKDVILESYESSYSVFGNSTVNTAAKIENLTIDSNIPISGFLNSDIKTLNIGSNVTSIGYGAFKGCSIINTPNISNVDIIGSSAFDSALLSADSITIKQGVEIGRDTFRNCNIRDLTLEGNNRVNHYYTFNGLTATNVTIGDGSVIEASYNNGAFYSSTIENLTIGKNVTLETYSGSDSAFGSKYSTSAAKIENLTIDSNIPSIGFQYSDIKTLNIGSNVTSIGGTAFRYNNNLSEALIDNVSGAVTIQSNSFPDTTVITYLK